MRHVIEYAPAKTGEYPSDIPQFSKLDVFQKNIWRIIHTIASNGRDLSLDIICP